MNNKCENCKHFVGVLNGLGKCDSESTFRREVPIVGGVTYFKSEPIVHKDFGCIHQVPVNPPCCPVCKRVCGSPNICMGCFIDQQILGAKWSTNCGSTDRS